MKVNRRLILLIIVVLTMAISVGCSKNLPEGIESKAFLKDMNNLYDVVDKSIANREYYKEDVDEIIKKMDDNKYLTKLNDYEIAIYELSKETLIKVQNDLTTGKKMIQSHTFDEVELIGEMLNN